MARLAEQEADPDWDWPIIGLLLDAGRSVDFVQINRPDSLYGRDWRRALLQNEFPRLIAERRFQRVGLVLNTTSDAGGELLVLLVAVANDAQAWLTPIERRVDGVRCLGAWEQRNNVVDPWWEIMLALQQTLAAFWAWPTSVPPLDHLEFPLAGRRWIRAWSTGAYAASRRG